MIHGLNLTCSRSILFLLTSQILWVHYLISDLKADLIQNNSSEVNFYLIFFKRILPVYDNIGKFGLKYFGQPAVSSFSQTLLQDGTNFTDLNSKHHFKNNIILLLPVLGWVLFSTVPTLLPCYHLHHSISALGCPVDHFLGKYLVAFLSSCCHLLNSRLLISHPILNSHTICILPLLGCVVKTFSLHNCPSVDHAPSQLRRHTHYKHHCQLALYIGTDTN